MKFKNPFTFFIRPPVLVQRQDKPPYSSFNQWQFWLYPELCIAQANEALSHCTPDVQRRQRSILEAAFGVPFAA